MKLSLSVLDCKDISSILKELGDTPDYIHLDVMDGAFVKNVSFAHVLIKSLRNQTDKPFDTHLMLVDPEKHVKDYVAAGSNIITFHAEATSDILKTIELIKSYNVEAGISIKPDTKVSKIKEYLPYVDQVLVMSVEPGYGGQEFISSSLDKIKELYNLRRENNYSYMISIDGGINDKTINLIKDYVDIVVVGSYITGATNKISNAKKIKRPYQ